MTNGFDEMILNMTDTTPKRRTTQARTGFYTAASAIRPKKPTFQKKPPNG